MLQSTHMPSFIRNPGGLRDHPALVLNADFRPLSYLPLSLWPWQEAVKAAFLDRVVVVAEYDTVVRSPSIRVPNPFGGGAEGLRDARHAPPPSPASTCSSATSSPASTAATAIT